ncbi:MAG TPA: fimbria/pilus periplasmic chaperone [Vicinamibacterales bacterium]
MPGVPAPPLLYIDSFVRAQESAARAAAQDMRFPQLASFLTLFVSLLAAPAAAATFSVAPTRVVLTPQATSTLLTLTNNSDAALRLQVSTHAWRQSESGELQLSAADDLVAFPGLLTLAPGETRRIRVAFTGTPGTLERSYRVYVEELAGAGSSSGAAVHMLTRLGIPVFVQPPKPVAAAALRDVGLRDGRLSFTLANTGNVFFIPDDVRVRGFSASGEPVAEETPNAWYVLAGGTRRFELAFSGEDCARVRRVAIEVVVGAVRLESGAETPGGLCGS